MKTEIEIKQEISKFYGQYLKWLLDFKGEKFYTDYQRIESKRWD